MDYQYCPDVFEQADEPTARRIILMDEADLTSEQRWKQETDFLTPAIDALPHGMMIDLGCGIGRLAKVYLNSHVGGCVLGTDISPTMQSQAADYVNEPGCFATVSPDMLGRIAQNGMRADCAIAVWSLQHMPHLELELARLWRVLRREASFLVVNRHRRLIPVVAPGETMVRWLDDGVDLNAVMLKFFDLEAEVAMPETLCAPGAYLRHYRKRPA